RLPLPAPLDGHTWPTVPSLLAASLALRGALDREAQQPFCDAPSRLWHVGVRDGAMDICCALHTAGFGFPLGTRWLHQDKLTSAYSPPPASRRAPGLGTRANPKCSRKVAPAYVRRNSPRRCNSGTTRSTNSAKAPGK